MDAEEFYQRYSWDCRCGKSDISVRYRYCPMCGCGCSIKEQRDTPHVQKELEPLPSEAEK